MSKILKRIGLVVASLLCVVPASAQYYQIANQLADMIQPALFGGFNYKGFVEADYVKGVGSYNADFVGVSTSQGFRYSNWFYMGVGLGVDVIMANQGDNFGNWGNPDAGYTEHGSMQTGVMIPLFTDFRFNVGGGKSTSFFADIKLGCSFLASDNYIRVNDGYVTSQQYFLFKPSVGVRIPVKSGNSKQAVDVGLTYQLLTANYWSSWNRSVTLNGLGINVAYEW
ncbi:MAG: hypothetical protein K2I91_03890 [Muribaculaceae bacterium]|nr:hypothetical protein [Muribaculaceae bacterium]